MLLRNQPKKGMATSRKFLWSTTLEEPVEAEHRELGDVLFNAVINIRTREAVMVEAAKEISILFFAIDFALGDGIVEFELLHREANRLDLLF